jgi:hypothetical protein
MVKEKEVTMTRFDAILVERKKKTRADYLNRLYHVWNVFLARGHYKTDRREMNRIKRIEGKIYAEQERRRLAGWPSVFTPPNN